ncbi:MAG: hypothetical protein AAF310_04535 [Myxococcota bacterium]
MEKNLLEILEILETDKDTNLYKINSLSSSILWAKSPSQDLASSLYLTINNGNAVLSLSQSQYSPFTFKKAEGST